MLGRRSSPREEAAGVVRAATDRLRADDQGRERVVDDEVVVPVVVAGG